MELKDFMANFVFSGQVSFEGGNEEKASCK